MSWKERMAEFGGGELSFLSEDGEVIEFVVVGEPVLLEGKYKGKPSEKIGCPVVTEDGFVLFVAGKRLARKLSKHEAEFDANAFIAIRHGEQNDITATYDLKVVDNPELTSKLMKMRDTEYNQSALDEAIESALTVMKQ